AAKLLCELAVERQAADADLWRTRAESVRRPFTGMFCGNVYYVDDPWIASNSWPGRMWHDGTIQGSWLPLWYFVRRGRFHEIAERLGSPDLPPWRMADRDIESDRDKKNNGPSELDILFQNRDLLTKPVADQATFDRLAALASTSDAAMLIVLRSEWKPGLPPATES